MLNTQKSAIYKINFGKDSLIHGTAQYYILPVLYMLAFYCIHNQISLIYLLAIIFVGVPVFDTVFQFDLRNPTKEEEKVLMKQFKFKIPIYTCLILDWTYTFYTLKLLNDPNNNISLINQILMVVGAGLFGGSNINVAHELSHKIETGIDIDYMLGMMTLSKALYIYWGTEHVYGHHKNVATPGDPATSKRNQTLYGFFPQTLIGTFKSSWNIECDHLKKQNPGISTRFHYKNKFFWYMANNIFVPLLIWKAIGLKGCIQFLIIAWISVLLLEIINYIEHYGLERKKNADGKYEKVTIHHSWNAPHRLSNYLLFKLQRHSDHHENSTKPYQVLKSFEESPTLPNGYALMLLLAMIPPYYFRVMNACLDYYNNEADKEKTENYIIKTTNEFLKLVTASFFVVLVAFQFIK